MGAREDARISTSLVSNAATWSFRIPSAFSERKEMMYSSYYRDEWLVSDFLSCNENIDLSPTYAHQPVIY